MTTITAFGNRKGGVGKTTTTLGIAAGLALHGRRVLVLDMDAQADATTTLGLTSSEDTLDIFDVLFSGEEGTIDDAIVETAWTGVDAVPGSSSLGRIEVESLIAPEFRLKQSMYGSERLSDYDDILIDLPPNLGRLTLNGLIAADRIVIVTEAAKFSTRGVGEFMATVATVQKSRTLNPDLRVSGIVINDTANPLTLVNQKQIAHFREIYGEELIREPFISRRTAVTEAQDQALPITDVKGLGGQVLTDIYYVHAEWLIAEEKENQR